MAPPTDLSYQYWKTLADGYEQGGVPVPEHVREALDLAAAIERAREDERRVLAAHDFAEWAVVNDGGQAQAQLMVPEKWRKLLSCDIGSINIFTYGPNDATGTRYLDTKATLDNKWAAREATHRRTKAFIKLQAWMDKNGGKIHAYPKEEYVWYLTTFGWTWTSTMGIGTGTRVHLRPDELPADCLVSVTGSYLAIVNGLLYVPNQTWIDRDVSREGTRAVYGYWTK